MTELTLEEIHNDLEVLKRDVAEIKSAIVEDGELTDWAKNRIESYVKKGTKKVISQEEAEKEFL